MTDTERQELRGAAERALPHAKSYSVRGPFSAFLALANPAAILSLLAERDALSEQVERMTARIKELSHKYGVQNAAPCEDCGFDWCGASCGRWPTGALDA